MRTAWCQFSGALRKDLKELGMNAGGTLLEHVPPASPNPPSRCISIREGFLDRPFRPHLLPGPTESPRDQDTRSEEFFSSAKKSSFLVKEEQ